MTRLRPVTAALVLACLLLLSARPAAPVPNPFGDRSTDTTVVLHRDGTYDVTVRQTVELRLAYDLTFGGGVHDGFRLADDLATLPPYLRAAYALTSFGVAPGQPVPADFTRTHHLVAVRSTGAYPVGRHTAEIRYRVSGAAVPTARGWTVHLRLLDLGYAQGDRVAIDGSELGSTRLDLRCVTFPPDSEPCGTATGPQLTRVFGEDGAEAGTLPPEYRVEVAADNSAVPEPAVDRG